MFNKEFAKDPMKMSIWELRFFRAKIICFTFVHYIVLTLFGVVGTVLMFAWAWQNLGF